MVDHPVLADEYTVEVTIPLFGSVLEEAGGAPVFWPVTHTLGFDIAEVAISLLDEEFYVNPFALGEGPPEAHGPSHENGGSDEISIAGLSGKTADAQTPIAAVVTLLACCEPLAF